MTVTPRQSANTSLVIPSQVSDTYELLLSVRNVLNTLYLDLDGKVMDSNMIIEDSVEANEAHN